VPQRESSHGFVIASTATAAATGQSGQRRNRAARPDWSKSRGRSGVSDLGGGEQPTAQARTRPKPRRSMSDTVLRSSASSPTIQEDT
jgi:hypothetical protein